VIKGLTAASYTHKRALYTGYWVNTWREILFGAVYFGVYYQSKATLTEYLLPPVAVVLSGIYHIIEYYSPPFVSLLWVAL